MHQAGHVVDPAVDVLDAVRAELLGECVVAAADHERYGRTAVAQVPGDLTDRSDAPGTGNQQGQWGSWRQSEAGAGRGAFRRGHGVEARVGDRAAHTDVARSGGPGLRGGHGVQREVDVDAVGHPQRVHREVGEVGEDGHGQ